MKISVSDGAALAKRMVFLAYQASAVVGMGVLQAREGVTEEHLWRPIKDEVYVDYGYGRMMKFRIKFGPDFVQFREGPLSADYQSWCGVYPTYEALAVQAAAELGLVPTLVEEDSVS